MTKFNRVNSKEVKREMENYLLERLEELSEMNETTIADFMNSRIKETEISNIHSTYINANNVAEFMVNSALDFEFETHEQKEFLDKLNLSYDNDNVNEKYITLIGYHLDRMLDIGVRINQSRKERMK